MPRKIDRTVTLAPGPKRAKPLTPLAVKIQKRLEALGWTNADFAKRISVAKSEAGRYASGKITPRIERLAQIAAALGVTIDSLVDKPEVPKQ